MQPNPTHVRPTALIRDLILVHVKLALEGIKSLGLVWLSVLAVIADLFLVRKEQRGRCFYGVLRAAERFDLWLNLYGPAHNAARNRDGLFGESRAGDGTFVGRMEELMRGQEEGPAHGPEVRRA